MVCCQDSSDVIIIIIFINQWTGPEGVSLEIIIPDLYSVSPARLWWWEINLAVLSHSIDDRNNSSI